METSVQMNTMNCSFTTMNNLIYLDENLHITLRYEHKTVANVLRENANKFSIFLMQQFTVFKLFCMFNTSYVSL
jgi:hypothetical protein